MKPSHPNWEDAPYLENLHVLKIKEKQQKLLAEPFWTNDCPIICTADRAYIGGGLIFPTRKVQLVDQAPLRQSSARRGNNVAARPGPRGRGGDEKADFVVRGATERPENLGARPSQP